MEFGHIELFCVDTQAAKRFYVDGLGFELVVEQPGGFVWVKSGSVEFLLRPALGRVGESESYTVSAAGIVLYTEDLQKTLAALSERGIEPKGNDGEGCPTFQDPDGHWIQIVENSETD